MKQSFNLSALENKNNSPIGALHEVVLLIVCFYTDMHFFFCYLLQMLVLLLLHIVLLRIHTGCLLREAEYSNVNLLLKRKEN